MTDSVSYLSVQINKAPILWLQLKQQWFLDYVNLDELVYEDRSYTFASILMLELNCRGRM